ncbi:hypothetical protein K6120_05545 [Neisseria flava]|jgi:hypothetical protein|uniref:hypothetical protein n=1 Tax=Neisseria sicca TaxID=490 RepID=UPI001ADDC84E|nr:hypothetical protein [Neisseria sicca]MBY6283584.1 hypothetical protein [Neisseria flava]QTM22965.1 hypothetical protein J7445_10765 [Neisseria sicca]
MSDILEKLSNGLLQRLMRLEWFLASLLIISFFDMYLNLRHGFSITALLNKQKNLDLYSIFESVILFSFIFSVIVPIIQGIYFSVILTILSKFNIYMFENENTDYRKSLYRLRRKAVKENNSVLWSAYQEEKANLQKINFIFSAIWGILIFSILGCFGKSSKSILIDIVIILNSVAENNILLGMVIYFLFFIISFWCFSILQRSFYLREDILPYWEDDKKANS